MWRSARLVAGMQIVCPQCATSYEVAVAAMAEGRVVRCTSCRHVWYATSESEPLADPVDGKAGPAGSPERGFVTSPDTDADAAGGNAGANPATPELDTVVPPDTDAAEGRHGESAPDALGSELPGEGEAFANAPPLVPEDGSLPGEISATAGSLPGNWDDDEDFAARLAARRKLAAKKSGFPRPSWTTMVLALLAVIAAILAWRAEVVRAMPQTASLFAKIGLPVNLRGLAFEDVKIEKDIAEGVPVLIVQGAVANIARRRADVPRLRFSLLDAAGLEVYSWTAVPARASLGPGESVEFRTRLASPPAEGRDVQIRFFTRKDR